jgi:hypothetical protein
MHFSATPQKPRPKGTSGWHLTRWGIGLGVALFLLLLAGCGRGGARPGVTYNVSVITKGIDGEVKPQGSVTTVKSAAVEAVLKIDYEGNSISLVVRKTQYGKATFDIIFPNQDVQRKQVKVGKPEDIWPGEEGIGVRIELQESH